LVWSKNNVQLLASIRTIMLIEARVLSAFRTAIATLFESATGAESLAVIVAVSGLCETE